MDIGKNLLDLQLKWCMALSKEHLKIQIHTTLITLVLLLRYANWTHGGLYGNDDDIIDKGFLWGEKSRNSANYIHVHKCIDKYRMEINPKLNTYMVQTAGCYNTILPESTYRGSHIIWMDRK